MKDNEQYLSHILVVRKSWLMKDTGYIEAHFDCICCGKSHKCLRKLFNKPIDYKLCGNDGIRRFDVDIHGNHLNYATVQEVIDFLEEEMKTKECARQKPFLALLKEFNELNLGKDEIFLVLAGGCL